MILESLLELVKTLKARIDEHGSLLRQSEWHTRYALIDPLLRELGWETQNPSLVIPEYQSGQGRADYALLGDGKPLMMVEAKKLGTHLRDDSVLGQGIQYCIMEGTSYFSVTDGQRWEVYETHKQVPINEKRVVEFDLKNRPAAEVCLKALALWRQSVTTGYVAAAQQSVVRASGDFPVSVAVPVTDAPPAPTPPEHARGWHPLTQVTRVEGQKPIELRSPDGTSFLTRRSWNGLMTESTRWLLDSGRLTLDSLPIQSASRYLVSTTSTHPGGKPMRQGKEVSGAWVETKGYSASDCVKNAITIIEHAGLDPSHFEVRFS